MKPIAFDRVNLHSGYLFEKQELNRNVTIHAVHDRFTETGRIQAFSFDWKEGDDKKPHVFWDSDVAKWIEGAAYILHKHPEARDLEEKIDALAEKIQANQGEDGYFNIYYTVVEPNGRFRDRTRHELYCAGHLIEAAVAYAEATKKTKLLDCMEKYADYIAKVFIEDRSAAFKTPGHEELELALVRLYRHTGKKKYLDMATHFINTRGTDQSEVTWGCYDQSHLPVRLQTEAVGHAVRGLYLYTSMAYLAAETHDDDLLRACRTLWEDTVNRKMYVTGGVGANRIGEAYAAAYDLPNDTAYSETCAAIALVLFSQAMLTLEHDARYADVVERALYNGVLSGLSCDGTSFFYENPLEINLRERFDGTDFAGAFGAKKLSKTTRQTCFSCSCCPPNLNRLLASLGNYAYGLANDTLYVNQFMDSDFSCNGVSGKTETAYPTDGRMTVTATGVGKIALRIPAWCGSYRLNKPYYMERGYAITENDGTPLIAEFDLRPCAVFADPRVSRDCGKLCIMRGPVVYCAEGIDNPTDLCRFTVSPDFTYTETANERFGLPCLAISCRERLPFEGNDLYSKRPAVLRPATLNLIPYNAFANRGESDMAVWLCADSR